MKVILLGWMNLKGSEKIALIVATLVGVGLAYLAIQDGYGILSSQGIGPLVMVWFTWQSTVMAGIMRMRSLALNHIFVKTLKELRDAERGISKEVSELIARFLGDKK